MPRSGAVDNTTQGDPLFELSQIRIIQHVAQLGGGENNCSCLEVVLTRSLKADESLRERFLKVTALRR